MSVDWYGVGLVALEILPVFNRSKVGTATDDAPPSAAVDTLKTHPNHDQFVCMPNSIGFGL